jgi:hypothetical protein
MSPFPSLAWLGPQRSKLISGAGIADAVPSFLFGHRTNTRLISITLSNINYNNHKIIALLNRPRSEKLPVEKAASIQ